MAFYGVGSDDERTDLPENVNIHSNVVYSPQSENLVMKYDDIKGISFSDNVLINKDGLVKEYGGVDTEYQLKSTREGFPVILPEYTSSSSEYITTDINGRKRNEQKTVGAFEANSLSARRFVPNQMNCGPRYEWNRVDPSAQSIGSIIKIDPRCRTTLYEAVKKSIGWRYNRTCRGYIH